MAWLANQLEVRCCEIPLGYEVDVAATAQAELLDVTGLEAEGRSFSWRLSTRGWSTSWQRSTAMLADRWRFSRICLLFSSSSSHFASCCSLLFLSSCFL